MAELRIGAPAKLNLHLRVGGVRPDGFHDIESVFLALAFGDTLRFRTVRDGTKITVSRPVPAETAPQEDIPPEKNIVLRAVSLFREQTSFDRGLEITVEKRIPAGGGLGGGSSNAAAALLALNSLVLSGRRRPADTGTLARTAAALGSDVPFFIHAAESGAAAALVSGRGERVEPFPLPEEARGLSFLLVNPGFPSDTASAYRLLDERRAGGFAEGPGAAGRSPPFTPLTLSRPPEEWPFFNDFLPVFEAPAGAPGAGAVYRDIISRLKAAGAGFAGLSGSGSTCFGVFASRGAALAAKETFSGRGFFLTCTAPKFVF